MPDITFLAQRRLDEARSEHRENWRGTIVGGGAALICIAVLMWAMFTLNTYPIGTPVRDAYGGVIGVAAFVGLWPGGWCLCSIGDLGRTKREIRRKTWDLGDAFNGEEPTELFPPRRDIGW